MDVMRNAGRVLCLAACLISAAYAQYGQYSTRSLLEKTLYFVQQEDGKIGTAKFWSLNLGKHSCELMKYFPGEGEVPLKAEVNFSLLSSAYIEGKGFSSRGKVDAEAFFYIAGSGESAGGTQRKVEVDSIDYVCNNGRTVQLLAGGPVDLILKAGNTDCVVKRMLLRIFLYDKTYAELKHDRDVVISAFAFSQASIKKAIAEMKKGQ